jgi:hypothetical protein
MPPQPPYTLTPRAAEYLAKIIETVMRLELGTGFAPEGRRDGSLRPVRRREAARGLIRCRSCACSPPDSASES